MMKMSIRELIQASKDYKHPNDYGLEEYVIKDGKKHSFALICPGGGYFMVCSFLEGVPYAKELNKRGISAFVLYYHVKEKAKYPAPQEDVARALKEIISRADELNLITEGYSVWGSSAGGHLAASFGTDSMGYRKYNLPKPGAIILSYPVITMTGLTHQGSRDCHLGENPSDELIELASVEKQITENYPPTFLWCGDSDQTVSPENSHMMDRELKKNHIPHEFIEYPEVDHGVGLGKKQACESWFDKAVAFWKSQEKIW